MLFFVESIPDEQWHAIYTVLPKNADIQFKIRIDQLETIELHNANVQIGVTDASNFSTGKFLYYYVTSAPSPVNIAVAERNISNGLALQEYTIGSTQNVTLSLRGLVLDIFFDGNKVAGPISLSSFGNAEKAFWMGYSLSYNATLSAFISDFSITEK